MPEASAVIVIGKFGKPHGLNGWIKVFSNTLPAENIISYKPWFVQQGDTWESVVDIDDVKVSGNQITVHLKDIHHCDDIKKYVTRDIGILRSQLPPLKRNEYYWRDLIGMTVKNPEGALLGKVDHLMETGANDVLVVEGEKRHLIPFILNQVVLNVDVEGKEITVDWDSEF